MTIGTQRSNTGYPKYDSVAQMKTVALQAGETVSTVAKTAGWGGPGIAPTGRAVYNVVSGVTYTAVTGNAVPDEVEDFLLVNNNVAMRDTSLAVTYPKKTGEVGVLNYEYEHGEMFRYIPQSLHPAIEGGTSTTDVSSYIRNAIASTKVLGFELTSHSNHTYFLGTFADSGDDTRFVIDFDNFVFNTNNCQFKANASTAVAQNASSNQAVFRFNDANNITMGDFRVTADTLTRDGGNSAGIQAVFIRSIAKNCSVASFGKIIGYKLRTVLVCGSADPTLYRYKGIDINLIVNDAGYYGLNCANNGDNLTAKIETNDVIRSYFPYGVDTHDVIIHSNKHYNFNDILIKRYGYDTRNINILYTAVSDQVSTPTIAIEHQNDTDDGVIENIYLKIDVEKSNAANPVILLRSVTSAGVLRTTTTSKTNNINLTGTTNATTPLILDSEIAGENVSTLNFDTMFLRNITDYKKWMVRDGDRRLSCSDAAGNMDLKFNVADYKFTPTYGKLTIWGADDASGSAANSVMQEMWIQFMVVSDGAITSITSKVIDSWVVGGAFASITIPTQAAGSWNLLVSVNGFANANRRCRGTLEIMERQPA